jgi:hypothetical protein
MAIDYTLITQEEVREELISLLKRTPAFKDADFQGSNLYELVNVLSYNSALFGYYLNQIANEPFIDSAKLYKNINRIANTLLYNPIGQSSAAVEIVSKLSKEYVLKNNEGFVEIPTYSQFPSTLPTSDGQNFVFTNEEPLVVQVRQYGVAFLRQNNVSYTGNLLDGAIDPNRLTIVATEKNPVQVINDEGGIDVVAEQISSQPHDTLASFATETEYSLVIQPDEDTYVMVIYPKSTSLLPNEIARFIVNEDRSITFTQNFSANKIYKGRIGYRNLETTRFNAVPIFGKPDSMGRLQLTVPRFAPAFEVLINGIVYSFSSQDEDIIIQSDDIPDGAFTAGTDINIILNLTDETAKNFGAKLELKIPKDTLRTDIIIGQLPINSETFENGNIKIQQNTSFLSGEEKSGVVEVQEGEVQKRVIFDEPYNIGDGTTIVIPQGSNKNYSVFIFAEGNVTTFYSEKATNGFKINIERDSGFTGKIYWRTVLYERSVVEEKAVSLKKYQNAFDTTQPYSIVLQPGLNVNAWVSDINEEGFRVVSDTSFVGPVDFLIIPVQELTNTGTFDESGSIFIPKGQTTAEITFTTARPNNDYRVFLQPSDNVKVFYINKSNEGFILEVEPETDFFGNIDWQVHGTDLSDTIIFEGGNIRSGEPVVNIVDLPETSRLGSVTQGIPTMSIIRENGVISPSTNGLNFNYDTDISINPGLSVVVNNDLISYNNLRVWAFIDEVWVEFQDVNTFTGEIEPTTKVFHVRVNKDKLIGVKFGNNDNRGFDPTPYDIVVIGLECVGSQGNIGENILSPTVVGSLNFNATDVNTADVQESFISLLGVKADEFFSGRSNPVLIDYQGLDVNGTDLSIVQLGGALFGSDPEGTESIRKNTQTAHTSQLRTVTNSDYKSALKQQFGDFLVDVDVFNYKQAQEAGLLSEDEVAKYYFNTLFIMMIPLFGTSFNILQRETINKFLEERVRKHTTIDTVVLEPTFIPIDVIVSYSVKEGFSAIDVKDDISNGILDFFDRRKRALGETITSEAIRNNITSSGLAGLSMQLNKDPNNEFSNIDYDVDIIPEQYESKFADVQETQLQDAIKSEIRTLLDKGLIQVNQPLFDVQSPDGSRDWVFSGDVRLERFEFPLLGDIVTEKRI